MRAAAAATGAASVTACEDAKKKKPEPKSMGELQLALMARQRRVVVCGTIDDESAKAVVAQLLFLEAEDPGAPIAMQISSGGGKVYAGLAIIDVMRSLRSPVHTTCLGHCESMAAVLLACGEPGRRHVLPNTRVMIHQPVRGASAGKSSAKEALIQAEEIEKSRLRLVQLLADATGRPAAELSELMDHDCYCNAEETVKLGLADQVAGRGHFFSPAVEEERTPKEAAAPKASEEPTAAKEP